MSESPETTQVMGASDIDRALTRISHEIVEAQRGTESLIVLGIPRRGVPWPHGLPNVFRASTQTSTRTLDPGPWT